MAPERGGAPRLPVLLVCGPTASGKSALAVDVAEAFGGVVINADSMQIYRELSILTARPEEAATDRAPHVLYGALPAAAPCSAARWAALAAIEIEAARDAGSPPVVVGGTGLYLKALTEGLADIPPIPGEVRERVLAWWEEDGAEGFQARLRTLDPESAARLPLNDRQRRVRAGEVALATGRPLSEWQRDAASGPAVEGPFPTIVLMPPREVLYAAIDRRFARMVEDGAIEEVAAFLRLGLDASAPAMKAVGVRELAALLRGESTLAGAIAAGQTASRHYAKRQMTWLRHQIEPDLVIGEQYSESVRERIFTFIRHSVLTGRD